MTTRRHPYLAPVLACLVTTSTVIMGTPFLAAELGAAVGNDDEADDGDEADVPVLDSIDDETDTREIVVNLEPAKTAHGTSRASTIDALQAHADWTQRHVVAWADERDGATVKNRFWLANAVLLEIDTGEVDLDTIPGENVRAIHPNYDVDLYASGSVGTDGDQIAREVAGTVRDDQTAREVAGTDHHSPDRASVGPQRRSSATASSDRPEVTYGLDRLDAPTVWEEYGTRGGGAAVAVLDTGVDPDHPDIDIDPDNWAHFDRSGDRRGTSPQDGNGHGTHTSGTITGSADPAGDVPAFGVAPDATLYHGKVLTDRGGGNYARIVAGMQWAVEEDVDVISMSLGVTGTAPELIEPSQKARDAGIVVVASSGNSGDGTSGSPGNVPTNVAVGASDENDDIARFSSGEEIDTERAWGSDAPDDWPDEYVVPDVAAPGVDVLSATPGGGYDRKSGTSMAAPHVAGAAALVVAASDADRDGVEAALEASAEKPDDWDGPDDERDTRYGLGVIDAATAVDHAVAEYGAAYRGTSAEATGPNDSEDTGDEWSAASWQVPTPSSAAVDAPEEFDGNPMSHRRRIDGEDTGVGVAA